MDKNWNEFEYFICEVPAGAGKSAIAKTICSSVTDSFVITSTKQLQDQYANDFHEMVSIKGKANYECTVKPECNCENAPCSISSKQRYRCHYAGYCIYENLRNKAMKAPIVLTSYQYFLRIAEQRKGWKERDVIVFDECHLLEDQIIQWAQITLSLQSLIQQYDIIEKSDLREIVIVTQPPTVDGLAANHEWISTIYALIIQKRNEIKDDMQIKLGVSSIDNITEEQKSIVYKNYRTFNKMSGLITKMRMFYANPKDWIVSVVDDGLQLTPLVISNIFSKYIDSMKKKKIVFMSATILDLPEFRKTFGLSKDNSFLIKADEVFDPKRSPIIYKPTCKMNYASLDGNLDKITDSIEKIMKIHKNEKGIIHSSNYKINNYIVNNISSNRFIYKQSTESNSDLIDLHTISTQPTILVSPSLTTGVDLKDDLSRWQIIVKTPFMSLADKRVVAKMKLNEDWYVLQMFKTFMQACGRSTRNEEDYSTTYVLDTSFFYWVNKYKNKGWFSNRFMERIQWK